MSMTGQHPGATMPGTGETAPPLVVVVVGDSRNRTRTLRGLLSAPGFVVAAEVCTALEAEAAVVEHKPGAVLLDLDPACGGIEAIERIMGTRPTPVVVCGAMAAHSQAALAAGAVDVVGALDAQPGSPQYVTALRRHLRVASRVRVITHPRNRLRAKGLTGHMAPTAVPPPAASPEAATLAVAQRPRRRHRRVHRRPARPRHDPRRPAGRPARPGARRPAHGRRVRRGPGQLAGRPVAAAGRDGPGRTSAAAGRRARRPGRPEHRCCAPVCGSGCETAAGRPVPRARGGRCVRQRSRRPAARRRSASCSPAWAATAPPGCAPCGTRGAMTIGQDEPTSVVWGMPAAAQALDAVERRAPAARHRRRPSSTARRRRRGRCRGMKTLSDDDFARGSQLPARAPPAWCSTRAAAPGCPASWPTGCASAAPRT